MTFRLRLPHPFVLLFGCIAVAAALTWVVPAGEYDRRDDPATGRKVVVAGTYHAVEAAPVGILDALAAVPRGIIAAANIIALVFLSGAGFTVVERTGTLRRAVGRLAGASGSRGLLVIPAVALAFGAAGALIQMSEELIAFAPVLLLLCSALGLPPLLAVAMSLGTATIAANFSPVDPFMVTIAQKVAEVPVGSGWGLRLVALAVVLSYWLWTMRRWALAHRTTAPATAAAGPSEPLGHRDLAVLLVVAATFGVFVVGAQQWGWDFDRLAVPFLVMGVTAGLVAGLGLQATAVALSEGASAMTYSALLIGVARGIFLVLEQGRIVDSVVHAVATPLEGMPRVAAAFGMMAAQSLISLPVPSSSGQAVLTMPVMAPVSDLLGLPRQVAVLAYQLGIGFFSLISPTQGPVIAMLAACGVSLEDWVRWTWPRMLVVIGISAATLGVAVAIGWR